LLRLSLDFPIRLGTGGDLLEELADAGWDFVHCLGYPRAQSSVVFADPKKQQEFAQGFFLVGQRARGIQSRFQFRGRQRDGGKGAQYGFWVQQIAFQFGKIRDDDL
jgi:hypothetical protein